MKRIGIWVVSVDDDNGSTATRNFKAATRRFIYDIFFAVKMADTIIGLHRNTNNNTFEVAPHTTAKQHLGTINVSILSCKLQFAGAQKMIFVLH
jgi:hypothetical protein